jgi:type IX secretion system substrate protein
MGRTLAGASRSYWKTKEEHMKRALRSAVLVLCILAIRISSPGNVPAHFKLDQNFPNPFNPSTSVRYELPFEGRVTLTVYNILGQQVKTLLDEVRHAGFRTVEFDGAKLPTGMYLYRLTAGGFTDFKKMLIVR